MKLTKKEVFYFNQSIDVMSIQQGISLDLGLRINKLTDNKTIKKVVEEYEEIKSFVQKKSQKLLTSISHIKDENEKNIEYQKLLEPLIEEQERLVKTKDSETVDLSFDESVLFTESEFPLSSADFAPFKKVLFMFIKLGILK